MHGVVRYSTKTSLLFLIPPSSFAATRLNSRRASVLRKPIEAIDTSIVHEFLPLPVQMERRSQSGRFSDTFSMLRRVRTSVPK